MSRSTPRTATGTLYEEKNETQAASIAKPDNQLDEYQKQIDILEIENQRLEKELLGLYRRLDVYDSLND